MRLGLSHLAAYAKFVGPLQGEEPSAILERMTRRIRAGKLDLASLFVDLSPDGAEVVGNIRLIRHGLDEAILTPWRGREGCGTRETIGRLLAEARVRARELGIRHLSTRVHDARMTPGYRSALLDAGFELATRRVEFKTPLAQMPAEGPSDLVWKTMIETGESLVLSLLRDASVGTPDGVDTSAGPATIENLLDGSYADLDPRSIQIGYLREDPVAVLVCRATPQDGWSTILFMGIPPAHRKRGLGLQVHRHGIATLRALGGTTYHDGTSESNEAMLRLFARQGCVEFARMEEWRAMPQP